MDRGAARSRKREKTQVKAVAPVDLKERRGKKDRASANDRPAEGGPSSSKKPFKPKHNSRRPPGPSAQVAGPATDPNQYKPKAIRTAHALIYSEQAFELPPTKEQLREVKRLDLAGSGVSNVSWLEGTGVTWLSLAGCPVEQGWEAVGSLQDLAVLNISQTGLRQLPKPLKGLKSLKALVAMSNEWEQLDEEVIIGWQQLNSLIISHSMNLTTIPASLSSLLHLSKLTFSHCPRLSAASLPDLSSLPLLRDVKMNNLPFLTTLPNHVRTWGMGDMSLVAKPRDEAETAGESSQSAAPRRGAGLDVLDLGNCGLTYDAIAPLFGLSSTGSKSASIVAKPWNLRSLTLASNPIAVSHPNYAELLQGSSSLPNLQIIDAKRVKERKRKGEVSESKVDRKRREAREKKMKPSGANVGGGKMRSWGGKEAGAASADADGDEPMGSEATPAEHTKKRKRDREGAAAEPKPDRKRREKMEGDASEPPAKREKKHKDRSEASKPPRSAGSKAASAPAASTPTATGTAAPAVSSVPDPSTAVPSKPPGKNETSVVTVIDVAKSSEFASRKDKKHKDGKRSKAEGVVETVKRSQDDAATPALDLKSVFGKKATDEVEDSGLGVGGW